MLNGKKYLLIAGGGTLGGYTSSELLRLGAEVEVICPEEKSSDNERLTFHRALATRELLEKLFMQTHYDGIVNFLHYNSEKDYSLVHPFLMENTDHLIFLSSYRVYADCQHPITESAPRLLDTVKDEFFLENEKYAVSKAKCEDYLFNERQNENWTIVRPVISFSKNRFDLLLYSAHELLYYAKNGMELLMPRAVKDFCAGIDWAGNSGKLIANLLSKQDSFGKVYTVYSGHGATWGEVADAYAELLDLNIRWCDTDEFLSSTKDIINSYERIPWVWKYDRSFERDIAASAILKTTRLTQKDFLPLKEAIKLELDSLGY